MSEDPGSRWSEEQPPPWTGGYAGGGGAGGGGGMPPLPPPSGPAWQGPPSPGQVPLRPLSVGDILTVTWGLLRTRARAYLAVAAVLSAIAAVIQALAAGLTFDADAAAFDPTTDNPLGLLVGTTPAAVAANVTSLVVSFVVQVIASGVFAVMVGAAASGVTMSGSEAWRRVRPRVWQLLGLTLLTVLAVAGVAVTVALVAISLGLAGPVGVLVAFAAATAGMFAMIYLTVSLVLAPPALVLERTPVIDAWRRSFALARGSRWRLLGIWLLAQLIALLLALIASIPVSVAGAVLALVWSGALSTALVVGLTQFATTLVVLPYVSVIVTLLYLDRRIRTEGAAPTFM